MMFPLNAFHEFGLEWSLVIAALIGIGFGFMLERGGFGSSKILSGIFYGRDWRVLKVMFTAIVTAMLGLYLVDGLGYVAMDQVAFKSTYLWGQIAGGFLLGLGFVTAGYCPGTSIVGAVSGKFDALFVILGIVLGIGVFEEGYAAVKALYTASYLGEPSLAQFLGLPLGVVVILVAAMALAAFIAVGRFGKTAEDEVQTPRRKLGGAVLVLMAALVAIAQFTGPGRSRVLSASVPKTAPAAVAPLDLAAWIVAERPGLTLIDLRKERGTVSLPGAIELDAPTLLDLRKRPVLPRENEIVLFGQRGDDVVEVACALRAAGFRALVVDGGPSAFEREVLRKDAEDPRATAFQLYASGKSAFDGGAPPKPRKKKVKIKRKKKKKGGGC